MDLKLTFGQFYGQIKMSRRVVCSTLTETTYRSGFDIPDHFHDHTYICFLLQGSLTEKYEKKSMDFGASAITFHPPGAVHSESFHGRGGRLLSIQIDAQWMQRAHNHTVMPKASVHFREGVAIELARKLYREFHNFDDASPLAIEGLILEILAEVSRSSTHRSGFDPPPWLRQAKELLHSEFRETPNLANIAELVGVHPVHLSAAFRKHYRCTAGEYLRRLRIEFVCHKLATSDEPISQIAAAAGFSDQSHCSKTFKLMTGMTPSQYKKLIRST